MGVHAGKRDGGAQVTAGVSMIVRLAGPEWLPHPASRRRDCAAGRQACISTHGQQPRHLRYVLFISIGRSLRWRGAGAYTECTLTEMRQLAPGWYSNICNRYPGSCVLWSLLLAPKTRAAFVGHAEQALQYLSSCGGHGRGHASDKPAHNLPPAVKSCCLTSHIAWPTYLRHANAGCSC